MTAPTLTRVIISVADLSRALTFYDGLLGLHQKAAPPGFAYLTLGSGPDAVELLLHERTPKPTMAGVALSIRVADVDTLTDEAGRLGCTIIDQPTDQPWGERLAVLTDLDGHVICLSGPVHADRPTKTSAPANARTNRPTNGPASARTNRPVS